MTGNQALAAAIARLRAGGIADPARDARRLLAHVIGIDAGRLTLVLSDPLTPDAQNDFERALARRLDRQPVAQITGTRAFFGRDFHVTPDVLDPRPDTETLIDCALKVPFDTVLDLGTGTGCILFSLLAERPGARGSGVDVSAAALDVARVNRDRLGLDQAELVQGAWFAPVTGRFDLIVSNPPYIAADEMPGLAPEVRDWEPHIALTDGGDGLDAYRAISAGAVAHLAPGGHLMVEIGPTQARAVSDLFQKAGLVNIATHPDIDGRDRVVVAQRRP